MSKAETADTVTISRAEYRRLLAMKEQLSEIKDRADGAVAIAGFRDDPTSFLPFDQAKRILAGESPVRIWRERRGMRAAELAEATGLTPAYVSEIENGKKPGSLEAFRKLARALRVTVDDLLAD